THVAPATLRAELLRLSRVKAVTAMPRPPFGGTGGGVLARSADEDAVQKLIDRYFVSYDVAEVFDLRLLAGRMFERGGDDIATRPDGKVPSIVVNRALIEELGFASPEAAVRQVLFVANRTAR